MTTQTLIIVATSSIVSGLSIGLLVYCWVKYSQLVDRN